MNPLEQFCDAISALEKTRDAIIAMSAPTDASAKREFIELRRQFQVRLSAVAAAVRECQKVSRDKQPWEKMSDQLAKLRLNTAIHQTDWPAVVIGRDHADYVESIRSAREAPDTFLESARKALIGSEGKPQNRHR